MGHVFSRSTPEEPGAPAAPDPEAPPLRAWASSPAAPLALAPLSDILRPFLSAPDSLRPLGGGERILACLEVDLEA